MAAGTEVKSVWIGFMDIVPVIGTVKEAVELVLALYEGDKAVIKVKEKAVEDVVKESLKKPVKPTVRVNSSFVDSFLPDEPAAAASEYSGLKNVKEVANEKIIEYVGKGSRRRAKLTQAEQEQRRRKLEAIKKDMLEKIRMISPNFKFNQELREQLERSKRGEHVFNNNILKFHFKVLTEFKNHYHIDQLRGYNQQVMEELGKHTLQQNTATEIQDNMVVHYDVDDFYVNANAGMYGEYSRELRGALLAVLNHINPDNVTVEERQRVTFIINNMNNLEIYVDQMAKEKWINYRQDRENRQVRFERVRHEVVIMYSRDRALNWCYDVMREVAPLFGNRV